jgi:DNA-binding MarR family transcriptional regulator
MTCGLPDCKFNTEPDDQSRGQLFKALLEVQSKMQNVPGGPNGLLILMVIAVATIEDGRHVNISTIADTLGMHRKSAKAKLDELVERDMVQVFHDEANWPMYGRTCNADLQGDGARWVREVYAILRHHLKAECDAMQPVGCG